MFDKVLIFLSVGVWARPQVQGELAEQACFCHLILHLRPRLLLFSNGEETIWSHKNR
jgi:hypothetical protein